MKIGKYSIIKSEEYENLKTMLDYYREIVKNREYIRCPICGGDCIVDRIDSFNYCTRQYVAKCLNCGATSKRCNSFSEAKEIWSKKGNDN